MGRQEEIEFWIGPISRGEKLLISVSNIGFGEKCSKLDYRKKPLFSSEISVLRPNLTLSPTNAQPMYIWQSEDYDLKFAWAMFNFQSLTLTQPCGGLRQHDPLQVVGRRIRLWGSISISRYRYPRVQDFQPGFWCFPSAPAWARSLNTQFRIAHRPCIRFSTPCLYFHHYFKTHGFTPATWIVTDYKHRHPAWSTDSIRWMRAETMYLSPVRTVGGLTEPAARHGSLYNLPFRNGHYCSDNLLSCIHRKWKEPQ